MRLALVFFFTFLSCLTAAPTDTLVSYWNFDDNVDDLATAGNTTDNGSWFGTANYNNGILGNGLGLDETNYVSVPDSLDVARTGSDLTVSVWRTVETFNKNWQCLVAKGEGSNWRIHRQSSNDNIAFAGGSGDIVGSNINDGQWHHIVAVSEAGVSTRLFVDGSLIPSGMPIVLSWEVGDTATSLTIDNGIGDVLPLTTNGTGSLIIDPRPTSNTTYTITATDINGTNTRNTNVEITANPIIEFFSVDDAIVPPGSPISLSWNVLNTTTLNLNGSDVTGTTSSSFNISNSGLYTLTASNANGSTSQQLQITVIIPDEPIISEFSADNIGSLIDEDGDNSDWIEIYNPSASTAILNNYYLTDDPNDLTINPAVNQPSLC